MSLSNNLNHFVNNFKSNSLKSTSSEDGYHTKCVCKWPIIISIFIFVMLVIAFVVMFVIFPVIFKHSPKLQKKFIFLTAQTYEENYFEYVNFQRYGLLGARNLYVSLENTERITLGLWHLLPEALVTNSSLDSFDYDKALLKKDYPVLLYFHASNGNRIAYINSYLVLRKIFHVITFDYRCYGDSSQGMLDEYEMVQDSIALYVWLRWRTHAEIYFWGSSLGGVLATHTIAEMKNNQLKPAGLFLEAPFPTMLDQIRHQMSLFWLTNLVSSMPWYESTMLQPFVDRCMNYNMTKYIEKVDCPIAIIHSQDDTNVPFFLGFKLYSMLHYFRKKEQGNVSFYALTTSYDEHGFQVWSPKLMTIVNQHLETCQKYLLGA